MTDSGDRLEQLWGESIAGLEKLLEFRNFVKFLDKVSITYWRAFASIYGLDKNLLSANRFIAAGAGSEAWLKWKQDLRYVIAVFKVEYVCIDQYRESFEFWISARGEKEAVLHLMNDLLYSYKARSSWLKDVVTATVMCYLFNDDYLDSVWG